jgi:LmbE family N-acetylglucosaminyl deacetylase
VPEPTPNPNPNPRRVLVVVAHPDDIEFMCAGTIARWTAQGAEVFYCLVTDGTAGSRDPEMTPERLSAIRREEQRAAAAVLGVRDVIFLGYQDGRVEPTVELRFAIARVIRRVRPDVVVVQDPMFRYSRNYINHPDHRAVAEAALAAIMPIANTRLAALELIDEGLEPHDVDEVYLAAPVTPDIWIPLEQQHFAAKIAALREHVSQMGEWDPEPMLREWSAEAAREAREKGGLECELAESFAYVDMRRERPPDSGVADPDREG